MVDETIPGAVTEWMSAIVAQGTQVAENETDGTDTEETDTETEENVEDSEEPASETEEENSDSEETQPDKTTMYATARVNVRASADTSAEKLGNVELGDAVVKTGEEGEWSIIEYEGSTGYVKTEYLTDDITSIGGGEDSDGIAEGTVVTLSSSVNVRTGMGETYDKIGTAYAGEKVTVVMSYAEGWTKVTWNGSTGYIKTSLLQ
jgi:uncharacterized protein YgiM (DUF1202 family)